MNYYNIYHNSIKINNRPLNEEEVENVKNSPTIHKKNNITNKLESIDVTDLKFVRTIII
jgi:hypothetical protein